jgi:hypothetical protein
LSASYQRVAARRLRRDSCDRRCLSVSCRCTRTTQFATGTQCCWCWRHWRCWLHCSCCCGCRRWRCRRLSRRYDDSVHSCCQTLQIFSCTPPPQQNNVSAVIQRDDTHPSHLLAGASRRHPLNLTVAELARSPERLSSAREPLSIKVQPTKTATHLLRSARLPAALLAHSLSTSRMPCAPLATSCMFVLSRSLLACEHAVVRTMQHVRC